MSRLRADVTACPTEEGMVLLDERRGRYWQLNSTGALIVQTLLDGATPGQAADRLADACPVTAERAAADVAALVDRLTRARLVTHP
ncbi:lasso peptide biosynthesis PqqD family chaperone [Streptomyces sp. NPDC059785]|uniref:lasso peptide biosynthesis PqqD family chaperone n=1 Tax=unclassified Streptomyces TaxID=2593676 RepID=UPI00364A97AB